ncbi:MAG: transcription elongation factor GreA [Lachnospiraceae bacterium]|nr:transcription elongation factor GreA [Lachnospiraceae bacterium]
MEEYITSSDHSRLEKELYELNYVKLKEIAQKIKEAKEQGDVTENAEYDAALEDQQKTNARIIEIKERLKNAVVIDESEIDISHVGIGCVVTVLNLNNNKEATYQIVGSSSADILTGKISNVSPVGSALFGKAVGEEAPVTLPNGSVTYRILNIGRVQESKKDDASES